MRNIVVWLRLRISSQILTLRWLPTWNARFTTLSAEGNPSLGAVLKVMKVLGLKLTPQVA
jgi:hypothetical protein